MKRLLLAAAVALGATAVAAADTLDVLVQNTLTLTDTQGGVTTVLLSEGGEFEQSNARETWASGFWTKEEDRLCMTARGAAMVCIPLEADKAVGDSWNINGPTGRVVWTARINEGRAKLGPAAPE